MTDRRKKNADWRVCNEEGAAYSGSYGAATLAVLMDLRDELQTLNRLLGCRNFIAIPATLRAIKANTTKKRRLAKKAA